jgi:hypothetical protein
MCVVKPVINTEWTFEIVDGPATIDLVRIAMCDLLNTECSKEIIFRLKPHKCKWVDAKIRVEVTKVEKVCREKWIIIGNWLDAKFESRPCSFRAEYLSIPKTGNLVFSFKYGRMIMHEDEILGLRYKTFVRG